MRSSVLSLLTCFLAASYSAAPAFAASPAPVPSPIGTARYVNYSEGDLGPIAESQTTGKMYFPDRGRTSVGIFDPASEQTLQLSVGVKAVDLAVSKDGNTLALAAGASGVRLVNTTNYQVTTLTLSPLLNGKQITSVAFDALGRLYLATNDSWGYIYTYDPRNKSWTSFGAGANLRTTIYSSPLIKIEGSTLVVGERGLSPASIYVFNVSAAPRFVTEDAFGSVGSNLTDFAFASEAHLLTASGSPYLIHEFDLASTPNTTLVKDWPLEAYPAAVDTSGDFHYMAAGPSNPYALRLWLFDRTSSADKTVTLLNGNIPNATIVARGVALSKTATKALVLVGDSYSKRVRAEIVDTGYAEPACDALLGTSLDALAELCAITAHSSDAQTRSQSAPYCGR